MNAFIKKMIIDIIHKKVRYLCHIQKIWDNYCAQKYAEKLKAKRRRKRKKAFMRRARKIRCALHQKKPALILTHLAEYKMHLLQHKITTTEATIDPPKPSSPRSNI